MFKAKFQIAFTLAEVLIVILIIGIVAELTIPTLLDNMAKQQYAISAKKAYSEIQQGVRLYMAQKGVNTFGDTGILDGTSFSSTTNQNNIDEFIRATFKVNKVCRTDTGDTSCVRSTWNLTKNATASMFSSSRYIFYTLDGMEFAITGNDSCTPNSSWAQPEKGPCIGISVDVNGEKNPNSTGRDIFWWFYISYDGTVFISTSSQYATYYGGATTYWRNATTCDPTQATSVGSSCLARIQENGWVMDY